jgi:large subunit ribosomal protein L23
MSLFNTQKKKVGNATAGETKLPAKISDTGAVKKVLKAEKKSESKDAKRAAAAAGIVFPKGSAVIRPRVTEKAGILSEKRIYTFDVRIDANTKQISEAIETAYKVTPIRINVLAVKSKAMFVRGKSGKTVAGKKAYVFLKEGDKIEFI